MEKQIVSKEETNELATPFEAGAGMGSTTIDASDIQIPKLQLLQAMSDGVSDNTFNMGDIIHTADQEVLAGKDKKVEVIPFHIVKVSQKFRTDVQPKEYILTEEYRNQPWEEEEYVWQQQDGNQISCKVNNFKTYIVHAIVLGDDMDMSLPVTITFRSSAGKDGKKIASHFATVMQFNAVKKNLPNFKPQPPYNAVWQLSSESVKGPKQSYFKWACKKSRKATDEEMLACAEWEAAISANAQKYTQAAGDESDVETPQQLTQKSGRTEKVSTEANPPAPKDNDLPF